LRYRSLSLSLAIYLYVCMRYTILITDVLYACFFSQVNSLLNQKQGKVSVASVRAAIDRQNEEAARDLEVIYYY